jgi:dolichol-phosphate mannosyltransferase
MSSLHTLVIIPTYEEADNIVPLVEQILAVDGALQVLVVDDASPDGTGALVESMAKRSPRVHVVRRSGKLGLGTALITGLRFGLDRGARWLITMDGDFSHDPRYLGALLAGMERFDLMIGSRYVPGGGTRDWPWSRRMLSLGANVVARAILSLPARDSTGGLRCYSRRCFEDFDPAAIRADGYSFQEEMLFHLHRRGARIGEIPIIFTDRRAGRSKISRREVWRAAATLVRLRLRGR